MDTRPGKAQQKVSARIWVLLASEATTAVIFRRGPTRWTRLYLWDTRTDTLTAGSWFNGNLYPWSSDLSPDGIHLSYFARNESRHRHEKARVKFGVEAFFSWTALCKPPWVKALGLWNASDGWSGGAIFTSNHSLLLLHDAPADEALIKPAGFKATSTTTIQQPSVVLASLQRTGWQPVRMVENWYAISEQNPCVLRKEQLELRFTGPHQCQYVWQGPLPGPDVSGVTWADLDQQGRLVYARSGRLYQWIAGAEIELMDLNPDLPEWRFQGQGQIDLEHLN